MNANKRFTMWNTARAEAMIQLYKWLVLEQKENVYPELLRSQLNINYGQLNKILKEAIQMRLITKEKKKGSRTVLLRFTAEGRATAEAFTLIQEKMRQKNGNKNQ